MFNDDGAVERRASMPKRFTSTDFEEISRSEQWQSLRPNNSTEGDLLPQNLHPEHLALLTNSVINMTDLNNYPWGKHQQAQEIPNLGKIERIGMNNESGNESKVCYLLTTPNGKKVIALVGGYSLSHQQIPSDSRIYQTGEGFGKDFYTYSDPRTYLCIPLGDSSRLGIFLQEYGGGTHIKTALDLRKSLTEFKAKRYIQERGFQIPKPSEGEFRHNRHYLIKEGKALLIDINIEKKLK